MVVTTVILYVLHRFFPPEPPTIQVVPDDEPAI